MDGRPAFDVKIDLNRNLVCTKFAGDISSATLQGAVAKVEALLAQMKPGFSVFADMSQVAAMDLDCAPPLTRIMDLCRARGVGLIVRMLPAKEHDIGVNLLSIVHYRGLVKTVTVSTTAEAERILG